MNHAMAYDAARQRLVLFGGFDGNSHFDDTWVWDGTNWVQRIVAVRPSARSDHAMAYDAMRQRVVMFGGYDRTGQPHDTWEWDGTSWLQLNPAASPPGRGRHAMSYDAARQRVVVHGGLDLSRLGVLADTWEWDGSTWAQVGSPVQPRARQLHAMAYDIARQRTVLFGGYDGSDLGDTCLHGNLVPAAAQTIGNACAGTNGPTVITSGPPFFGNQGFVVDLLAARASSPCVLAFAGSTQGLSLGGGCTLYVNDPIAAVLTTTNPSGFGSVNVAISLAPWWRGAPVYVQGVVLDPLGGFAGLSFSAGLKLVLGD